MWYRDPKAIIALERRIAGIETSADQTMNLVLDCSITPGEMFARAVAKNI